ncbi:MAG: class D beta-lactamase [Methylobacterium frigidaeris]
MKILLGLAAALALVAPASAATLCTIVTDAADGRVLLEQGDCRTRVTPASTFKVPLAVMGFDAGFLKDAGTPVLAFRAGDPAWGGEAWKQPTDPARWMRYSVVWYSQRITHALGGARVADYARRFGFGNADLSGDPGKGNGLDRAWIMSSLKVSPVEQAAFLRTLINRQLPVAGAAIDGTLGIIEATPAQDGWVAHGKTGTAFLRTADGSLDEARGFGWYVGWMTKAGRTLVFARLDQDERRDPLSAGLRTRASFVAAWPSVLATLPR